MSNNKTNKNNNKKEVRKLNNKKRKEKLVKFIKSWSPKDLAEMFIVIEIVRGIVEIVKEII